MWREYHKWFSPRLGRDMELLVFGRSGARVLVFPAREGRFYDYENWGLVHALRQSIDSGLIQLFCVDSVDSEALYNFRASPAHRIARHRQYEDYILSEVVPLTRLINDNPFLISHGCSFGAYHAMNIALRHAAVFGKVVALSGRYDLTTPVGDFADLLSGHYSEDVYFHMPNHFLPNLQDWHILGSLRHMDIVLAVGGADPFLPSNRLLSGAFDEKSIPNRLAIWPGLAHSPGIWRKMVPHYL